MIPDNLLLKVMSETCLNITYYGEYEKSGKAIMYSVTTGDKNITGKNLCFALPHNVISSNPMNCSF